MLLRQPSKCWYDLVSVCPIGPSHPISSPGRTVGLTWSNVATVVKYFSDKQRRWNSWDGIGAHLKRDYFFPSSCAVVDILKAIFLCGLWPGGQAWSTQAFSIRANQPDSVCQHHANADTANHWVSYFVQEDQLSLTLSDSVISVSLWRQCYVSVADSFLCFILCMFC